MSRCAAVLIIIAALSRCGSIPPAAEREIVAPQSRDQRSAREIAQHFAVAGDESVAGIGADMRWDFRGPQNLSGLTYSLLPDAENPNVLFSGSSEALWRSDDAGEHWRAVPELDGLAVMTLVRDPQDHNVIYAATGFEGGGADGIYKTVDRGLTWRKLANSPVSATIRSLAISPSDSNVLLAGTSSGVFRSPDAGDSWMQVIASGIHAMVAFAPDDGSRAIAGLRDEGAAGGRAHVLNSIDSGVTFVESTGITSPVTYSVAVAYAPSLSSRVYVATNNQAQIWRSDDGGRTFKAVAGSPMIFGYHVRSSLFVAPADPDLVIYGGIFGSYSVDGAMNFANLPAASVNRIDFPHTDYLSVVADPAFNGTTNRRVYLCTDGGVFVSDDFTRGGWRMLHTGHASTQYYSIDVSRDGVIVGGMQDTGVSVTQPGALDTSQKFNSDITTVLFDPLNDEHCFAVNFGKISMPCGTGLSVGDAGFDPTRWNTPLVAAPTDSSRVYAAGMRVLRIDNVQTGPVARTIRESDGKTHYSALAVDPSSADIVWVASDDGRLDRTNNATSSSPAWSTVFTSTAELSAALPASILIDRHDSRMMLIGGDHGILQSADGGATWHSVLSDVTVRRLVEHPTQHGWLYAATSAGLFASSDNGASWSTLANESLLSKLDLRDLVFQPGTNTLYVATMGRGVWSAEIPVTASRRRAVHR